MIHSNRGSQYVSKEYRKATEKIQHSYPKKAIPWDNACIESVHSLIKREWLNRLKIRDYNHAYLLIFEYWRLFTTPKEYTATVIICHLVTLKNCTKNLGKTHFQTQADLQRIYSF